jgi:beta-galactosidase/beta-glucuronidase
LNCYIKDYPRPQFVRRNWVNLNGTWEFAFDDNNCGEKERWYRSFEASHTIQVPFTYETKLSGIGEETAHNHIWYHRQITVDQISEKVILHFEGSDYETKVWINGQYAGNHFGGYSRFSLDITDELTEGTNNIIVKVSDSDHLDQPRGKQRWKEQSFECWYVQTTGIWKTVWLEYVPKTSIRAVKMTPNLEKRALDLIWDVDTDNLRENLTLKAEIRFEGQFVNSVALPVRSNQLRTRMEMYSQSIGDWGLKVWTPWNPFLYDIKFTLWEGESCIDTVESYFGMRDVSIKGSQLLLNRDPIYQRLILDQGYWKDSHLTPPNEEALIDDVEKVIQLGFNGVRKHQKTEDERFLYWCDVKGLLVWSEAPSTYLFSDDMVNHFMKEWMDIVRQNYNHPCIITWTPVNESWGVSRIRTDKAQQSFSEAVYHVTKAFDPMRPVIVNDGWEHTVSDIITIHDYQESGDKFYEKYMTKKELILDNQVTHNGGRYLMADGYQYQGQPIMISEYGGIAFHNNESGWGYGNKVSDEEGFIKRYDAITSAIKKVPYITGYCYTQLTDVQQEINGLMTIDRVLKVDQEKISEINRKKFGY